MKMCLYLILVFNIDGCSNFKSTSDEAPKDLISNVKGDSSLIDKKVKLIETVLNLPGVIKFSKIKFIGEKFDSVFILLKDSEFKDNTPSIVQDGYRLSVLHNLGSLDTTEQPCYIFNMEFKGDTASVQMTFDITGAIAVGKLNYIKGHWVPDSEFKVGVR